MKRIAIVLTLLLVAGPTGAQDNIQRGKIKTIDLEKLLVTLSADGGERTLAVLAETRLFNGVGQDQRERLQAFKPGAEVYFRAGRKNAQDVLVGMKLVEAMKLASTDTAKLRPLPELGAEEYHGFQGGFYPDGKNQRPAAHEAAGLERAKAVQPLDDTGKPNPTGKIVLLSLGMSNTSQASQGFQRALNNAETKNPHLVFVNGAQGGMTAAAIQNPDDNASGTRFWSTVDQRLRDAGVTRQQVQVVWIKQADAGPTQGFPAYARKLQGELANIVQILPKRFPNVKLAYLSSRTYGGYATTPLNPEPYAYESAFSVKWLIEQQLNGELNFDPRKGEVKAPWLSWGPYLWANGSNKRQDGFSYAQEDFVKDGTHLSPSGQQKVGRLMLQFFETDSTTRPWFVGNE